MFHELLPFSAPGQYLYFRTGSPGKKFPNLLDRIGFCHIHIDHHPSMIDLQKPVQAHLPLDRTIDVH
jgi:hypothetical protein